MQVQMFLSCSRKRGLFGHVVTKSREAWQTLELYRARNSKVHQTHFYWRKSIWACRECLGQPISKRNGAKKWCFGWVIPEISFAFPRDYKHWQRLQNPWLIPWTTYNLCNSPTLQLFVTLDYKSNSTIFVTVDYKSNSTIFCDPRLQIRELQFFVTP